MSFWVVFGTGVILGGVILLILFFLKNKKKERRWSKDIPRVITFIGLKSDSIKGEK